MPNEINKPIPFIRELCKDKTEAEILDAEQNFREYLLIIKDICERVELEQNDLLTLDSEDNNQIV